MARTASTRKPARTPAAERRARTLARDGVKEAERITLRVLDGGKSKSSLAVRRAGQSGQLSKKRRRKAAALSPMAAAMGPAMAPGSVDTATASKLADAAPVFGDVLRSIGHAVAMTQTALDDTALASLQTLAAQKVDVPVLVEQTLTDDGIPDTTLEGTKITTASMPLTSIIMPSMQQVDQMTLRMDVRVAGFDATSGIKFNQNIASAGASFGSGGFGFALSMSNTNVNAQFSNMSDFSSGSVMMSLDIVDRTGFQIPTPLEYVIGASLLVRLTSIGQKVTAATTSPPPGTPASVKRTAELTVKEVKRSGAVELLDMGDYEVTVPPGLQFIKGTGTTDKGKLTISYSPATAADPYVERKCAVNIGPLTKEFTVHL